MHIRGALAASRPAGRPGAAGPAAAVQDPRPFKSGIDVTGVTVTVRDADGRLVTGLTRDDFDVFEDGDPQTMTQFTRERVPVSVGVLLDISDSMFGRRIDDARGGGRTVSSSSSSTPRTNSSSSPSTIGRT